MVVELALILTLVVLPIAFAIAQYNEPVIAWVTSTAKTVEHNNELVEENNRLLRQLLEQGNHS